MKKSIISIAVLLLSVLFVQAQEIIPLDTLNWTINSKAYVLENYKGQSAIYLKGGSIQLKDTSFFNGTIEYDIYLKETPAFPGVFFRINDQNAEHFYLRPHQSGNPDANQAIPLTNGLSPWQLYFGKRYSFPYDYHYDDWTHVKLVVNGDKAQVYLNHSETPNLSWNLFHSPKEGTLSFTGGGAEALHLANIKIDKSKSDLKDFKPLNREPITDAIKAWQVSDKFDEELLEDPSKIAAAIQARKWGEKVQLEEGVAANISRQVQRFNDHPGNTVFAKVEITASKASTRLLEFGYSDRVVVLVNGKPVYKGNNKFRSRDYRYLGTVGLYDAVYIDLKKGKNTLLMAVSEDFGGWLVTGRIANLKGLTIK